MATYLITGTSRGLGLAIITHLSTLPSSQISTIFALARTESPALKSLVEKADGRVVLVKADVTNEESIKKAAVEVDGFLGGKGLDVLVNNVGIMGFSPGGIVGMDDLSNHFTVNVLSAHWTTRTFMPLLEKGALKKVVNITTTLGSFGLAPQYTLSPAPAYKISKAALNMLTVQYAMDYAEKGFTIFALSPGWLKTDLGGGDMADLPAEVGAKASLDRIFAATKEDNGQFLNIAVEGYENVAGPNKYNGLNPPW
ncbi:short chain dehydrogenase reductase [Rhexocercosporidium sp. MPI-PUGE-AT-0058]|nr:short chain dehydrogenase reductase [Rhexocercosporidium sp. MPI-PUGE-AT-0058]